MPSRPANLALIGDLVAPERRKTAFSVNRLAINLGMSVGPALGGFLATVSFRGLFWVDGATSLAAGAILVFGRPYVELSPRELVKLAAQGEAAVAGSAHADNVSASLFGGFILVGDGYDVVRMECPEVGFVVVMLADVGHLVDGSHGHLTLPSPASRTPDLHGR